jgi:hypothetical protein
VHYRIITDDGPVVASTVTYLLLVVAVILGTLILDEPVTLQLATGVATRAYVARRKADGRTTKDIMRVLKRYIPRQISRTLAEAHPAPAI